MITTLSLTGKNSYNRLTISGKQSSKEHISLEIKKIKIFILNNLIIPLLSKQWKVLNENLICLSRISKKIDYYYDIYKLDDLVIYRELLKIFDFVRFQNDELETLEKQSLNNMNVSNVNNPLNVVNMNLTTMIHKTHTIIKLKPEYEIYDLILGKPNKKSGDNYNEEIIKYIEKLLLKCDISFNKIKETILKKFCE
jgi:hypothetical protein